MAETAAQSLEILKVQLATLQSQYVNAMLQEAQTRSQLDNDPNNADTQALLTRYNSMAKDISVQMDHTLHLMTNTAQLQSMINTQNIQENLNSTPVLNTSQNSSVRLNAPKQFTLGSNADFDTFLSLTENFLEGDNFAQKVRIFRTLLAPDAYKLCKSIIDNATDWESLVNELRKILGSSQSQATHINNFLNCHKKMSENLQEYASRLRLLALKAYPDDSTLHIQEPMLIQRFINTIGLNTQERNILNATQPKSLSQALEIASNLDTEHLLLM